MAHPIIDLVHFSAGGAWLAVTPIPPIDRSPATRHPENCLMTKTPPRSLIRPLLSGGAVALAAATCGAAA